MDTLNLAPDGPTLVLNADGHPLSLLPPYSISWQDAIALVFLDRASVLHYYEDWEVRSPSTTMRVPAVVLLRRHVAGSRRLPFTRRLVFMRDEFTCQYCSETFPAGKLTIDHVLPRSCGGKTRWDNVCAACEPCNVGRGSNVRVRPKREPWTPTYSELVAMRRKMPVWVPHRAWNWYIGWPENLVRFRRVGPKPAQIASDLVLAGT